MLKAGEQDAHAFAGAGLFALPLLRFQPRNRSWTRWIGISSFIPEMNFGKQGIFLKAPIVKGNRAIGFVEYGIAKYRNGAGRFTVKPLYRL
jgi:hypothetical protein